MENNDSEDDDEFFIDSIDNLQEETLVERAVNETDEGGSKRKKKFTPNYNVAGVIRVELNELTQNSLGIEVGPDITGEHPWKMVKKELLYDNMQVLGDDSIFTQFKPDIDIYEENELLFGYILEESNDSDEYYVCLTTEAKNHCQFQAEKFLKKQAKKLEKSVFKVANPWKTLGSEKEVDENMVINSRPLLRVEIKTKYPTQFQPKRFQDRDTDAARDGYTELVPTRTVYDNVVKKKIDAAVQANPEKKSSEAQTVPKFPQNVWTQCGTDSNIIIPPLISEEEKPKEVEIDESLQIAVDPETPKVETHHGKKVKSVEKDLTQERLNDFIAQSAPEVLNLLDFNSAIDIYNLDYPDLVVSDRQKDNEDTYFEEFMCLTDERAKDKFILSSSWHPSTPGIVSVAYADFTNCILESSRRPADEVHRAVFGKNPVLVWSTSDSLRPMLYLESNREVTTISFCPFDENILIGGRINGQIIIWDLTDKLHNNEALEVLTETQEKNRIAINSEMGWMKNVHQKSVVRPAALSDLAFDHVCSVTDIIWLHPKYEIKKTGKIEKNDDDGKKSLQFLSASEDGTILVWDLDLKNTQPIIADDIIVENISRIQDRPSTLTPKQSPYNILDGVFQPIYKIVVKSDLNVKSETLSAIEFGYPIIQKENRFVATKEDDRTEEINSFQPKENVVPIIWVATTTGEFFKVSWNGHLVESDDKINCENCVFLSKSKVHDGPIICVARNPYFPDIVATLGGRVFALWSDSLPNKPLMWKTMNYDMTDASWSEYIPSQIFITTGEGSLDIWDFLQRSDFPITTQIISGKMLTGIFMQPYSQVNNSFGVADYKGDLRLLNYPKAFKQANESHFIQTKRFFERELEIKNGFQSWQDHWSVKHADILEKRKQIEDDLIRENESNLRMAAKRERERKELTEEASKLEKNRVISAEEKWRKLQWEYFERVLQEKKKFNKRDLLKQEQPLKELEAQKREKIKKQIEILTNRKKIFDESVAILFPEAAPQPPVIKKVIPIEEIMATKKKYIDEYNKIAEEADNFINENPYEFEFNWQKTLLNGKERRRGMDVRSSVIRMKNERLEKSLKKSNIVINTATGSQS